MTPEELKFTLEDRILELREKTNECWARMKVKGDES